MSATIPSTSEPSVIPICAMLSGLRPVTMTRATQHANAVVSGHVYYENGNPVEGALVDFRCFCGTAGILPPPTHTDKQGSFTLSHAV